MVFWLSSKRAPPSISNRRVPFFLPYSTLYSSNLPIQEENSATRETYTHDGYRKYCLAMDIGNDLAMVSRAKKKTIEKQKQSKYHLGLTTAVRKNNRFSWIQVNH